MSFIPGQTYWKCSSGMCGDYSKEYDQMTWFGRGPHENYADRKTSAAIGIYQASVWEQFHPYVRTGDR